MNAPAKNPKENSHMKKSVTYSLTFGLSRKFQTKNEGHELPPRN